MKFVTRVLFSLGVISLAISLTGTAYASDIPPFPMAFWGNVTVDNTPAPAGTVIRAYYGSTLAGTATTTEAGIYGYSDPTKQKLLVGQGSGAISFTFQNPSLNNGTESTGSNPLTYPAFASDTVVNLDLAFALPTSTPITPKSSAKAITSFSITTPAATGSINEATHTITLTVPYGTDITSLSPTITISDKASIVPASGATQNFTNPVTYTVTAEDGTTQDYAVAVNALPALSSDATLSNLAVNGTTVTGFSSSTLDYALELPAGTTAVPSVTAITTDPNATTTVTQATNLPGSATVTVTAQDGTTTQNYKINFTVQSFSGGGAAYYYISVTKSGDGTGSVTANTLDCNSNCAFPWGTIVNFTASASPGSVFSAWSGSCDKATSSVCSLVLNSNIGVGAVFSAGTTTSPGQVLGDTTVKGAHPNGTLVLDKGVVYLISNGKLRGFRNPTEFLSYGFSFGSVVPANSSDMMLPQGQVIKAIDGTLAIDTADNRTIYLIGNNGIKRGFASETVFKQLGYNFNQAVKLNLSDYPTGSPINSPTAAHPDGTLVFDGKTAWLINSGKKYGFPTMDVFNSYGWSWTKAVPANAADASLPQGSLIKPKNQAMLSGSWLQ